MIWDLRRAALALALPILAGMAWMAWVAAPPAYLLINGAALLIGLLIIALGPMPRSMAGQGALALIALALLFYTSLFGADVDGVRRWFAIGPLRLHAGYLLLPYLLVVAGRLSDLAATILLLLCVIFVAGQPDFASATGLAAAAIIRLAQRRSWHAILLASLAIVAAIHLHHQGDALSPVALVEAVQADGFAYSPIVGAVLTLVGFAPILLLLGGKWHNGPWVAFVLGAGLCAFVGAYPSILIGYGAAPILGFALAIRASRVHAMSHG